jgi:hypothetical protein
MDAVLRKWNCSHSGRLNRSVIGGESVCSYCGRVTVVHGALVREAGPLEEGAGVGVSGPESDVRS